MPSDHPLELNHAVPGGRVEMFAVRDDTYPGGWFYRFQYYHPDEGEILRYDNAHEDETIGWHHRHVVSGEDTEVPFQNIVLHVTLFLNEIAELTNAEGASHD